MTSFYALIMDSLWTFLEGSSLNLGVFVFKVRNGACLKLFGTEEYLVSKKSIKKGIGFFLVAMECRELDDLRQQLKALQHPPCATEATAQLSEHNVIDILEFLLHPSSTEKRLGATFGRDGREVVTWLHLENECVEHLSRRGGRYSMVELARTLGIELGDFERLVLPSLKRREKELRVITGDLMNVSQYVKETLLPRVHQETSIRTSISLSQLCREMRLPAKFVFEEVTRAVADGNLEGVTLDGESLFAASFVRQQLELVRAATLACVHPSSLTALQEQHAEIDSSLFRSLLTALIRKGDVEGQIDGDIFFPVSWSRRRSAAVEEHLSYFGYIKFETAKEIGVLNPLPFLTRLCNLPGVSAERASQAKRGRKKRQDDTPHLNIVPDAEKFPLAGFSLAHGFITHSKMANVAEDLAGKLSVDRWINLSELFPPCVDWEVDSATVFAALVSHGVHDTALQKYAFFSTDGAAYVFQHSFLAALSKKIAVLSPPRKEEAVAKALLRARKQVEREISDVAPSGCDVKRSATTAAIRLLEPLLERETLESPCRATAFHSLESKIAQQWRDVMLATKGVQWATATLPVTFDACASSLQRYCVETLIFPLVANLVDAAVSMQPAAVDDSVKRTAPSVTAIRETLLKRGLEKESSWVTLVRQLEGDDSLFCSVVETVIAMNRRGEFSVASLHALRKSREREALACLRASLEQRLRVASFDMRSTVQEEFGTLLQWNVLAKHRVWFPMPWASFSLVLQRLDDEEMSEAHGQLITAVQMETISKEVAVLLRRLGEDALRK